MTMTLNEYQTAAQRTSNTQYGGDKINNGILGLFGEGGELADIYKKFMYQNHPYDRTHLIKELGDVLWYVAEIATGLGVSLDIVAQMNIDKLKARYPEGFDSEKSLHRKEGDI